MIAATMITELDLTTVPAVVDLLNHAYRSGLGWTTEKGMVTGQRASEKQITNEINAGACYFTYQDNATLIGCFSLTPKPTSNKIEIGALAVSPKHQGQGLGKQLLTHAENISAQQFDINTVEISVLAPRAELIQFYQQCGYQKTALTYPFPQHRDVGTPTDKSMRVLILEKNIR